MIKARYIKNMKVDKALEETGQASQDDINKVFDNMKGYIYSVYKSEYNGEYIILEGITEEAEKEYEESIYKSLIEIGEDEEYARKVAKGEEEPDGVLYFPEYCFEFIEGEKK